jgi:hypothetical protein
MPEICRFFGILISMYYNDHNPPHFHVRYGEQRAIVEIKTLDVREGYLSPRVYGLVTEWAVIHREELERNWARARDQAPLNRIAPLE